MVDFFYFIATVQLLHKRKIQKPLSRQSFRHALNSLLSFMQEFLQQIKEKQMEATRLNEAINKLTGGQVSPVLEEIRRLAKGWMELGQRAEGLEAQRGEDMQRSGEYQESVAAVEELFHQVSREWDYLARYEDLIRDRDLTLNLYIHFQMIHNVLVCLKLKT